MTITVLQAIIAIVMIFIGAFAIQIAIERAEMRRRQKEEENWRDYLRLKEHCEK